MSERWLPKMLAALLLLSGSGREGVAGDLAGPGNLGNLWCVGDSWTDCFIGFTWRRKLSQNLRAAGWQVNFVGTRTTNRLCETGQRFDRDHNGIAGMTAQELLDTRLTPWLNALTPDTVLLLIGGNDFEGGNIAAVMTRIGAIIDRLRADNPDVVIHSGIYGYVGVRIADATVDEAAVQLQDLIAAKTSVQSPIHFVDHRIGWNKTIHLSPIDRFHPSRAGMNRLAVNWQNSIEAHQAGFAPSTTQYQPDAMIGERVDRQLGANRHSRSGNNQRVRRVSRRSRPRTFYASVENDGNHPDVIALRVTRGNRRFRVHVFERIGRLRKVTARVLSGRYRRAYDPGQTIQYRIVVSPRKSRRKKRVRTFRLRAVSLNGSGEADAVKARMIARGGR